MQSKCLSFLCKGILVPGIVIFTSLLLSIINFEIVSNNISKNCGKITGYLDGDLYTDARATGDSNVMTVLSLYLVIYFLINYCVYKGLIVGASGKSSYYIINALFSIGAPLIGMLWMDLPQPLVPANVYFSLDEKFIELPGVQITYLQENQDKVRIIMASDSFSGFESYLAPGPWMIPFSFSWMNSCLVEFVNFQLLIKKLFIACLAVAASFTGSLIFASFVKFRNQGRIQREEEEDGEKRDEERKSMI